MGFPVLALCIFLVPELGNIAAKLLPEFDFIKYLVSMVFDASAIPFYFALYQAFKLLRYIDTNKTFSQLSAGGGDQQRGKRFDGAVGEHVPRP